MASPPQETQSAAVGEEASMDAATIALSAAKDTTSQAVRDLAVAAMRGADDSRARAQRLRAESAALRAESAVLKEELAALEREAARLERAAADARERRGAVEGTRPLGADLLAEALQRLQTPEPPPSPPPEPELQGTAND